MQRFISLQDFLMQNGVNLDTVVLNQVTRRVKVALALDSMNLSQQLGKKTAQGGIIVDLHVGLSLLLNEFHNILAAAFLISPTGNQGTVAHVGVLDDMPWFDANHLRQEPVHHIRIILAFVGLCIRGKPQFHQFFVGDIIKSEKVGTRLLDGRAISAQGI